MKLPVDYRKLTPFERKEVREEYVKLQKGRCSFCNEKFDMDPPKKIRSLQISKELYPDNFFNYPIHLHHDHKTGMTIGAVHCHCNAVLWEYYNE